MKKLILLFAGAALVINLNANRDPGMTMTKATKAVQVDGVVDGNDPWGITWIDLTYNKTANTTSAMTGKFQITYDDSCLYLVVDINDPTQGDTAAANTWERDCIEVFVGMDTNTYGSIKYKAGDFQFRNGWATEYPWRFEVGVGDPAPKTGARLADFKANSLNYTAQVDDPTEYITEWSLSWRTMLKDTVEWVGNEFIGFDVQIADNTTNAASGRSQQTYWWNNEDQAWHNITLFGIVKLATPITWYVKPEPPGFKNVTLNKFSVVPQGKLLVIKNASSNRISIYNIAGQRIKQVNLTGNTVYVDLDPGLYLVNDGSNTAKVVIK